MQETDSSINRRTLAAIKDVPRQVFVAAKNAQLIAGHSIPPESATIKLLSAINFQPGDHVLQIGTGSGYLAAIMASLVGRVTSIEKVPMLASLALRNMRSLRLYNVDVITGDGSDGYKAAAPYNIILVSTPSISSLSKLFGQLKPGGKLFSIEGGNFHHQILVEYTLHENRTVTRKECGLIDFSRNTGEILLEMGMLDEPNLAKARKASKENHTPLIEEILKLVQVDDLELYRSLATQHNLRLGNIEQLMQEADAALFEQFPRAFLDHNKIIPLSLDNNKLLIASSDPEVPLEDLKKLFNKQDIETVLVTPKDFYRLWSALDLLHHDNQKSAAPPDKAETDRNNEDLLGKIDTKIHAHLISLFEAILLDAISENASDIHLERYGNKVRVRQRIDGELHDVKYFNISPDELNGLVNVIKLRAELDIAEKRLPQGGRARLRAGKDTFDLRVQTQPSLHGEHVVIRILPQTSRLLTIRQ
ncbi:MAG: Flp pilus assembly complex ATPase component TadA, partial [Pseudomonadales bacterium]|nr:Flp pilus assembly complex ATPase component TadA [Pseudomonadales bacterium]